MPPRILGPRDYFSGRTFGDTAVQAMQIKAGRSQMADAEARRAREPQEQRIRDMREAQLSGQMAEEEGRRGAYAEAYGGAGRGYEAEAMQAMRDREIKATGTMFSSARDIADQFGIEAGNDVVGQMWNESPELQKKFPKGPPKMVAKKGKDHHWEMYLQKDTPGPDGNIMPAGSMVKVATSPNGAFTILGMTDAPKTEKPEMSESKARAKQTEIQGKLHTLESNPMAYAGDPAKYKKALLDELAYARQFLPERPGQLAGGDVIGEDEDFTYYSDGTKVRNAAPPPAEGAPAPAPGPGPSQGIRYGVDNATGRKVMMLPDGTIEYAP